MITDEDVIRELTNFGTSALTSQQFINRLARRTNSQWEEARRAIARCVNNGKLMFGADLQLVLSSTKPIDPDILHNPDDTIADCFAALRRSISNLVSDGRNKSIAFTKLDEAQMWLAREED